MWKTIYTDGTVFANKGFLDYYEANGGYLNEFNFQKMLPIWSFELHPAKISKIEEEQSNTSFLNYILDVDDGKATMTMPKSFNPVLHSALGVNETENLEGIVVQAIMQSNRLMGFRALPK